MGRRWPSSLIQMVYRSKFMNKKEVGEGADATAPNFHHDVVEEFDSIFIDQPLADACYFRVNKVMTRAR